MCFHSLQKPDTRFCVLRTKFPRTKKCVSVHHCDWMCCFKTSNIKFQLCVCTNFIQFEKSSKYVNYSFSKSNIYLLNSFFLLQNKNKRKKILFLVEILETENSYKVVSSDWKIKKMKTKQKKCIFHYLRIKSMKAHIFFGLFWEIHIYIYTNGLWISCDLFVIFSIWPMYTMMLYQKILCFRYIYKNWVE